jgi:hypothetical protein
VETAASLERVGLKRLDLKNCGGPINGVTPAARSEGLEQDMFTFLRRLQKWQTVL